MKKARCIERLLGISILLCSCGEKADVSQKKGENKAAELNAGAATPQNLTCQVELHDANLEVILDGSVQLEVLAEGFEIAEGPALDSFNEDTSLLRREGK